MALKIPKRAEKQEYVCGSWYLLHIEFQNEECFAWSAQFQLTLPGLGQCLGCSSNDLRLGFVVGKELGNALLIRKSSQR